MNNETIEIQIYRKVLKQQLLKISPTTVPEELDILVEKFSLKKFKKKVNSTCKLEELCYNEKADTGKL